MNKTPSINFADKWHNLKSVLKNSLKDKKVNIIIQWFSKQLFQKISLTAFTNKDTDFSVNSPSDTWNVNSSAP